MLSKFPVNPRGWKIIKRMREKKHLNEIEKIKVDAVEIQIGEGFVVKVMSSKDLYKD